MSIGRGQAIVAIALAVLVPRRASAEELDAKKSQPYDVTVAVRFDDDPLFTRQFVQAVERQVRDQLTNVFGSLAAIRVATDYPLFAKLRDAPLSEFALAPQEFVQEKIGEKVFLVTVGQQDGAYRVAWRQIDGDVRYVGPLHVRTTPDRQWVAKAICLGVKEDFAPVALVHVELPAAGVDAKQVRLEFRGAARPQELQQWLTAGAVFLPLAVIRQQDGSLQTRPIPNTVLRIGANDGPGQATVVSNLANPWKRTARTVGFKAVKLSTQSGRIRLRLVDDATGRPVLRCDVYANETGFGSLGDEHRLPSPDRQGQVVSREAYDNLAFVRISQGGGFVQFPLPITGPWSEMTCRVTVDKNAAQRAEWTRQLRYLEQDLGVLHKALNDQVKEVNDLHAAKRYEDSLRRVKTARDFASSNVKAVQSAKTDLDVRADELDLPENPLAVAVDQQIAEVVAREAALGKLQTDLQAVIESIDAQSRADVFVTLGTEALQAARIDEAVKKYEQALAEQPDQPQLKKRLAEIKEAWRIKSPAHEAARNFAYERWPLAEVTQLDELLPEADRHFAVLRGAGDHLTSNRLRLANNDHVASLTALINQLAEGNAAEDVTERDRYTAVADRLIAFRQKVIDYIAEPAAASSTSKPAGKTPPPEEEVSPK